MNTDWMDSVILIVSKDENNKRFGTGFVIHHGVDGTFILTCSHVVRDVGGKKQVCSGGWNARVIVDGADMGVDLAVLQIDTYADLPVIGLNLSGEKDRLFVTAGFQLFDKKHFLRELNGHLGKQGRIDIPQNGLRIPVWDLMITGNYCLQPGYSGSPVVDKENGCAIAVVSHRQGEGERGLAVSLKALGNIWPDMPEELLQSLHSVSKAKHTAYSPLSETEKKFLQQKRNELQRRYDMVSENLQCLTDDYDNETRSRNKLRLRREMDKDTAERDKLEKKLTEMSYKLKDSEDEK